ncbi:MAG: MFS transporter [Candidatus Binatia bacterium]|nr:MFS transporter [Candidatus Binatia bacterium]
MRHRHYAFFWCPEVISSVGHFINEVALYWLVYEITGSALALGILGLCEAGPRLILGPVAGVLVDRYDRLRLLIFVYFCSSIPTFTLVAFYFAGTLQYWHILALMLLWAIIRSINPSAAQSLIRELVPDDELMNAVSLYTVGFNIARVTGPSFGGVLILWIGAGGCFLLYSLALVVSGAGLLLIRIPQREIKSRGVSFATELREGVQYVWHAPVILSGVLAASVISVFVGTYQRFLPIFAKEVLAVGPEGLGLMMAAPGLGAILCLTILASIGETWRQETLLWVTATLTPLFLITFCLSSSFTLSVLLLILVGGAQITFRTVSRVIIQMRVPTHLLGRVISVFLMDQGMRSVGSMVIGAAASLFGATMGLSLTSVVCLAVTSVLFYRLLGRD